MTAAAEQTTARPDRGGNWRRTAPWLLASAFYVALTVVHTWPLVTHLPDVLPNDLGDAVLNAWIIWWNAHVVPLTARWWNGPIFWPSSGALAFSETLIGLAPLTTPIQWLGGSPITAYNVAFLLTFPLSAIAAHALVFRLSGRHDAALIAGLVYGFHPFRIAHFPQIQVMTSYWMPLALLGLHEFVADRKIVWLWISAGAWLMQALSNGYYLLFFPVLVAVWLAWFALSRANLRTLAVILGAWAAASLPLIPMLWTYRQVHAAYGFTRDVGEVNFFGADMTSLLDASPLMRFWRVQGFHQAEGELFPGVTAALLVLLVLVQWLWRSKAAGRASRACLVLLVGAIAFIGVALSPLVIGPWALKIGRTTLLSVRLVGKPLSLGVLLFVLALAFEPRFAGAWRRRSLLMFYVLATGLMYLLCFGPTPRFLGVPFMFHAPYSWLMVLPGYDAIRVPARFAMLAALCLSVSAGLAFARLTLRMRWVFAMPLTAVVVAGVLLDSWIRTMPVPTLPPRLHVLETLPADTAVAELPLGYSGDDVLAMYRGMYHGRPLVNGYSGFFPRSYDVLTRGLATHDPEMFDAIAAWGPVAVAIDSRHDDGGQWTKQLAARPGTVLLGEEGGRKVFMLTGGQLPPEIKSAGRLHLESVSANVQSDRIGLALDGNPATRWDSGPQRGLEVITIDLGSSRAVEGVTMTIGRQLSDFPRNLVIERSENGNDWTAAWQGRTALVAFTAAVRHPRDVELTFALTSAPARFIRLRQLGQDPVFYWSIFELGVLGH
jgi:F5/8 type C domain